VTPQNIPNNPLKNPQKVLDRYAELGADVGQGEVIFAFFGLIFTNFGILTYENQ
jgi:hypothetical protein